MASICKGSMAAMDDLEPQSQWASLPKHILDLFIDRLTTLHDLFRFSCVCQSWRSASSRAVLRMSTLPWLIVPYQGYTSKPLANPLVERKTTMTGDEMTTMWDDTLGFVTPFHCSDDDIKMNKEIVYKVELPEVAGRRICGSSEGWLVTVHENSAIQLLNPISRDVVGLPPLTKFPGFEATEFSEGGELVYLFREHYCTELVHRDAEQVRELYIVKVVTNTSRFGTLDNTLQKRKRLPTVVMAIHAADRSLAYYRPGFDEERWSWPKDDDLGLYQDVTFYKGDFYAVTHAGHISVVKGLDGPTPFMEIIKEEPQYETGNLIYLVESSGDLLMVVRHVQYLPNSLHRTEGFRVVKLDFSGPQTTWMDITDIHGRALFVGYNNSFSCAASDIPGCKRNCIYFTDNCRYWIFPFQGNDIGVYSLEDGSIETLYATASRSQFIMPPPIWLHPPTQSLHQLKQE